MQRFIAFLVKYPVWSNVVLYSTLGFGLISFFQMRYSFFPEVESGIIAIQVAYPGASPQEVEEGVILKIEENLTQKDLFGIDLPYVSLTIPENVGLLKIVTKEFVKFAHLLDIAVFVWTINSPEDMKRLINWGVDGIFTDNPAILIDILK